MNASIEFGYYNYYLKRLHLWYSIYCLCDKIADSCNLIVDRPYQVSTLIPEGGAVPLRDQNVTYTSFKRHNNIEEKDTHRLYLGGDAYSAPVVYVKNGDAWQLYYLCRDYLGSITHIANADGSLKAEYSYDAWGRLRDPETQVVYEPGTEPILFLGRGYTGHEHLPWFGLINMNARLYDPTIGRFLSPDPYVQAPDFTQNLNRYSYCLNNPFSYTDQNGEWIHIAIGAAIGGVCNLASNWKNIDGIWDGVSTVLIGAATGAVTAATGGAGFWTIATVSAGSGAIVSAHNNIVAQTGKDFSGFTNVNWSNVGKSSIIGGVSGFASGSAGFLAANSSLIINNCNSPILRSAILSPLSAGVGHVVTGTTQGLFNKQSLHSALINSFDGIEQSMIIGIGMGMVTTISVSYAYDVSPWTG